MHYLIKMCSLCLCHNKDLTKVDKIQQKFINFLNKVLLQPSDSDKMKLDEEYLCKMCIDKLESCFGLSELCIKNKIYSTFCCVCTNSDRSKLMNLRKISPECASFYCKLIKSVRPQIFTCEKCLEKLNFYLQFQKICVKNNEILFGYMQQLTNYSTEKIFKNSYISIKLEKLDAESIEKLTAKAKEKQELSNLQIVDIHTVKQEIVEHEQFDIEENLIYETNEPQEIIPECKIEICEEDFNRGATEKNPTFNFNETNPNEVNNEENKQNLEEEPQENVVIKNPLHYDESNLFFNHFLDSSGNDFEQKTQEDCSEIDPNDLLKIENENPTSPQNETDNFSCKFCPDNKNIKSFKLHKFVHLDKSKNQCLICHKKIKYYKNLVAHLRKHYREKPQIYYSNVDLSIPQTRETIVTAPTNYYPPNQYLEKTYPQIKKINTYLETEIQESKITNSNYKVIEDFYNPEVSIIPKKSKIEEKTVDENFDVVSTFKNIPNLDSFGLQYLEEDVENMEESIDSEHFNDEAGTSLEPIGNGEKFICKFCPEGRNVFDSYRTHKFEHMNRLKVQCLICFKRLKYYRNLVVHVTDHFKGSQFYCPYCKTHQVEKLVEHKYKHLNQAQNLCLICLKKFDNFNSLNVHIHTHFKNWQRYKKLNSNATSSNIKQQNWQRQLLKKKIIQNSLERLEVTPSVEIYDNEPSTSTNDMFICPFCPGREYVSQKQHKFVHMDRIHNICLICNSKFAAYKYLYKHLMKHFYRSAHLNSYPQQPLSIDLTRESNYEKPTPSQNETQNVTPSYLKSLLSNEITLLPYDPRVNQKSATQNPNFVKFKQNFMVSSNIVSTPVQREPDYPYTCPFCEDKEFPSFLDHKLIHINKENNQCLICGGRFSALVYVDRHVKKHLTEKKSILNIIKNENNEFFNCQYCNCVVEETYYKHFYKHVNINERYCLICNKEFIHIKYLYKHLRNHFGYTKVKKFIIPDPTEDGILGNCPYCIEPVNESLPLHRLVHVDPLNKVCLICYKKFGADDNLLSHIAFHFRHFYRNYKTPDKPIVTTKIEPKLKLIKNDTSNFENINITFLKTNTVVDLDKLDKNCPFCPNITIDDLSDHKESHIKPDVNQCLICAEKFDSLIDVKNHIEEHYANVSSSVISSPKLFCRYCNIEVLRKSFEKHKISNMHLYYVKKNPLKKPLDNNSYDKTARSFCRVCKVYLNRKGFAKHKNSKMHRDNLRNKNPEKFYEKKFVSHRTFCSYCQSYITTKNFDEHTRTKKHLENMKLNPSKTSENENLEDASKVSAELVSELSNVDDNETSITLENLKTQISNQEDQVDEEDQDDEEDQEDEEEDPSNLIQQNIEDISDNEEKKSSDKYFCNLCNTEVLKKSYAKHSISKMHLENLNSNKNDNSNEKSYGKRCPKCNRGFANQTSYLRHVKGDCKFVPAKFQCELCKARFRRRYILGAHMQKVHGLSVMDSI